MGGDEGIGQERERERECGREGRMKKGNQQSGVFKKEIENY